MAEAIAKRASLTALMDEVVALEERVAESVKDQFGFSVYVNRWRPRGVPDFPCIYNWLAPSPGKRQTTATMRDTLSLQANCGVRWTDVETEMQELEQLADQFRLIVDQDLQHNTGLGGLPHRAERPSMNSAADRFNDVPVLVLQFTLMVELDRIIT